MRRTKTAAREIDLNAQMAETFVPVADDLFAMRHSEYWLYGGRASTKSSAASLMIVGGLLQDRDASAIVYRRYGNTLKDSVYSQLVWAIDRLELTDYFKFRTNPLEITCKPTGQRIMFRGMDDPMKSKSIKLERGYFKFLWVEELAELRGLQDVRTVRQSVFRGVDRAVTIFSYNPPRSANAWVNAEVLKPDHPERLLHRSTYLDVPEEWLKGAFLEEAESLKHTNPLAYRNEYLGEVTGNGGNVFENVSLRQITDEEISGFEWFYQGVDWGYFPDPFVWIRMSYSAKTRTLYIIDEYSGNRLSNREAFDAVCAKLTYNEPLTADSAEPKSIADWREYGASWTRPANKAAVGSTGSVAYSMKWLASLREIVIDPARAPLSAREFTAYEYERNAAGEFVSGYADANNHAIDAVRYATSVIWRRRGE